MFRDLRLVSFKFEILRKLAAEKQSLEKNRTPNAEIYITKIDSLETKILKLSEELRQARMSQVYAIFFFCFCFFIVLLRIFSFLKLRAPWVARPAPPGAASWGRGR